MTTTRRHAEQQLVQEFGRLCVTALRRAFAHPTIKLDEAGTFDDLILNELHRAAKRRYANEKTFRAWARLCYLALTTDGLDPENVKDWHGTPP